MQLEIPRRWVLLRFRFGPGDVLWVSYEDDRGHRRRPPDDLVRLPAEWIPGPVPSTAGWLPASRLHRPADLVDLVTEAVGQLPLSREAGHAGVVALPVFVDPPTVLATDPWERLPLDLLQPGIQPDRIQPLRLARRRILRRPRFRLPLGVLAVGEPGDRVVQRIRLAPWYQALDVRTYGLNVHDAETGLEAAELLADLAQAGQTRDVVLCTETTVGEVLARGARLSPAARARPRLVVMLDRSEEPAGPFATELEPPRGTSLIRVPGGNTLDGELFVSQLLHNILHDLPLHEAFKAATRVTLPAPARLVTDPASIHDLRMADAYTEMVREALDLSARADPGSISSFLGRLGEDAPPGLARSLERAGERAGPVRDAVERIARLRRTVASSERAVTGLVPLASAMANLQLARQAADRVEQELSEVAGDPAAVAVMRRHQDRRVDVRMEPLEPGDSLLSLPSPFLGGDAVLRGGSSYRLWVQIGRRWPESLLLPPVPAIDPLLPELETEDAYSLDVVVFGMDFAVSGPHRRTLHLPLVGPSDEVSFDIRAPRKPGPAILRICLYHRDHLVQSLRLEAEVAEREALRDGPDSVLRVVHEFSRTARFANLDALGPRALSIAVNQDLAGASHRFQLKRHGKAKEVRILEATIKGCIDDYREILTDAAEAKTKAGRHDMIRRLARLGRKLYMALAQEPVHEPIQPTLLELKPATGETIQIVRLHSSFVFPWPILYDYPMPKRVYDGELETTPVCLGGDGRQPCGHGPELKGCYCVNGFWGIRHRIEQLIDARETDQPELDEHGKPLGPLVRRPPRGGVRIAVGTVNNDTSTVAAELKRLLRDDGAVAEVGKREALLDLLWEDQTRPAVLVVLGHLKTSESPPEPSGPRIESGSLERYLAADDIGERWSERDMARWIQPQTLVLLMACESGATELESLSDFVRALTSAGARAVIGTETKVRSDLLARFSKEMTAALWGGPGRPAEPLGTALNRFWREQLQTGDPRAFTFYAVGDADLIIAPAGNGA